MKTERWIAVRKSDDGHEWFDTSVVSLDLEQAKKWSAENEVKVPHFYRANPVVRFARVVLQEQA